MTFSSLFSAERRKSHSARGGKIVVLFAVLLPVVLILLALAIDTGILMMAGTELQRAADAAALAGVSHLRPTAMPAFPLKSPLGLSFNVPPVLGIVLQKDLTLSVAAAGQEIKVIEPQTMVQDRAGVLQIAREYSNRNAGDKSPNFQVRDEDIELFRHRVGAPPAPPLIPVPGVDAILESLFLKQESEAKWNAVRVTLRRDGLTNPSVPFYFAAALGHDPAKLERSSAAAIVKGYGARPGAKVLPFGVDVTVWRALRLGNGTVNGVPLAQTLLASNGAPIILVDEQKWSESSQKISSGSDGIWEALLLTEPLDQIELPGLTGGLLGNAKQQVSTVAALNLGGYGKPNVVAMRRQIQYGLSTEDAPAGIRVPTSLPGQSSIPSDLLGDLEAIVGQPRMIPLFETISGTAVNKVKGLLGQDTSYRIVGWGGVVVTKVGRLGVVNYIKVQPTIYMSSYVSASSGAGEAYSDCVYTSPTLIE